MLTAERLRELLHYDPETGIFTRKVRTAQRHHVGVRADFPIKCGPMAGYCRVSLDSRRYLAHRLAWFYVYGWWPTQEIDHRDTDRGNNQIKNLRDVSDGVNKQNRRAPFKNNKCGLLGVSFNSPGQWRARIKFDGKVTEIGIYPTAESAHSAYLDMKRKHHEGCTL